jgi:hypothetical protein
MPDGLPPANGIESNVKLRVKTPQGSQPGLATNLSALPPWCDQRGIGQLADVQAFRRLVFA